MTQEERFKVCEVRGTLNQRPRRGEATEEREHKDHTHVYTYTHKQTHIYRQTKHTITHNHTYTHAHTRTHTIRKYIFEDSSTKTTKLEDEEPRPKYSKDWHQTASFHSETTM